MDSLDYKQISSRLKLLTHPERLKILDVLRREPECVCHLEALMAKPQPYISQQLGVLRQAGVIEDEKRGHNVFYRLVDTEVSDWLEKILGPIEGEHPEMVYYKEIISCGCPKCEEELL